MSESAWHPIGTAPHNGAVIDGRYSSGAVRRMKWLDGDWYAKFGATWLRCGERSQPIEWRAAT